MGTIAVKIVLQKLTELAEEEAQLLGGVQKGVKRLQEDLESMKSFLQDAEARSEMDKSVKTWVKQVREVAYDAEDVLEEFFIRLELPSRSRFHRHFLHYFQNIKARHRLGTQLLRINENVRAISERRNAFSFNQTDEATSSDSNSHFQGWHDPRAASLYKRESELVGIEKPKTLLISWLTEGGLDLTAISVVGMGGMGKTTLAKKIFDSQLIKNHFVCQAWVTVSKSFTNAELLQCAMKGFLEATKEPVPESINIMEEAQLVETLKNYLKERRYLVVFDDVWSLNTWEVVKYALPDSKCGSRILFTSRRRDIGESLETNTRIYDLLPLPDEAAWNLFCMKSFLEIQNEGICPLDLVDLSRSILKKCGGLPLAIVVVGGLLSKKDKTVLEWKKVYDSFAAETKNNHGLESLGRILLIGYNQLPYYLKSCYLYLSVFPEDYLIKTSRLIRLWLAERLVEEKQGFSLDEVAEEYLNDLVSRSLLQVVEMNDFSKIRSCRVHDLMREILQLKCREESLVMVVNGSSNSYSDTDRRMSIHEYGNYLPSDMKFPNLRSLLVFRSESSMPTDQFPNFLSFRLLRVLELELAPISQFPEELMELILLRYLSLRRTRISELPESIGKLKSLENLDLKFSLVSKLPAGILKLKNLLRLQCYRYHFQESRFFADTYGFVVPNGIGSLTNLERLGCVELSESIAKELEKLTKLKKLGVVKLRKEDGLHLCTSLEKLRQLFSLYLVSVDETETIQLNYLSSPPQFLQRLYLKCGLVALPQWITSLQHLSKLVLQDSNLDIDPLKALQKLPKLVILELRAASTSEELCCEPTGYPHLKRLCLSEMENLKQVRVARGAMPGLKGLDIASCHYLQEIPSGIEHLDNLQELQLWDMSYIFLTRKEVLKVQHIPTVKFGYQAVGRWVVQNLSISNDGSGSTPSKRQFDRV